MFDIQNQLARIVKLSAFIVVALLVAAGCDRTKPEPPAKPPEPVHEVVAYCSVDREFAEPILAEFQKRTGIKVHRVFDTEAGKTTGLLNRLIAEKARPRADVWWSSEIFGTIQLADQGILAEYRPATAADIPDEFHDPSGRWTAMGLRGRVLAYDPRQTKPADLPKRWIDLLNSRFKGKLCMADPRFGTTRGHMAAMLYTLGPERMKYFYEGLKANGLRLADGNSQSVLLLTRGAVGFAATDTDDVIGAQSRGDTVDMCFPSLALSDDNGPSHGTLYIPCSVGVLAGSPDPQQARALADYLVSAEVEEKLAHSESRNVPVRAALREKLKLPMPVAANIDYAAVAKKLDESDKLIRDVLLK